jgi:hypothetical protein
LPDACAHDYTVHFAAGEPPPARFFWSATMYQLPERLLVDNHAANWLPAPEGDFRGRRRFPPGFRYVRMDT